MELLKFKDVRLEKEGKYILQRVNFSINRGEIYAIVGKNGAGKSTIAYTLMGIPSYRDIDGKIIFEGKEINNLDITQRANLGITLLWQEPVRYEGIKVKEYLKLSLKKEDEEKFKEALELVGLNYRSYIDRYVDNSLSGGERKRIELAAIYLLNPKLVILDEPDSGIDIEAINYIFNMLNIFKQKGTTVLLITHSLEVLKRADRGTLICCGVSYIEGDINRLTEYFGTKCPYCEVDYSKILAKEEILNLKKGD